MAPTGPRSARGALPKAAATSQRRARRAGTPPQRALGAKKCLAAAPHCPPPPPRAPQPQPGEAAPPTRPTGKESVQSGLLAGRRAIWLEIFSAATMVLPSLYAACFASGLAERSSFPEGVWTVVYATYAHCVASVAFHLRCAVGTTSPAFDQYASAFRTGDMTLIHVCCILYGWALAHGDRRFAAVNLPPNVACILSLVWRRVRGVPGTRNDSFRIIGCIFLYTTAILRRHDWVNYLGLMASYGFGGLFWARNQKLGGWGHGLFHVMLLPAIHCVLHSTGAA